MTTFLIIVLVALMAATVFALVRGIIAFLQSTKEDLERAGDGDGATEMQLRQNRMMFSRIKYQALAILVVGLILVLSR
jgi:uncharacterized protein involved in cysteine biosynthesis